jgi:hypothetical protein
VSPRDDTGLPGSARMGRAGDRCLPQAVHGPVSEPLRDAVGCCCADRWVSMPNDAHESPGRGRFLVQFGPTPALWRSAHLSHSDSTENAATRDGR